MTGIEKLNALTAEQAKEVFFKCCSSTAWVLRMVSLRPFQSVDQLFLAADQSWQVCSVTDCMEAFSHHPKIGGNMQVLREKYQATKEWSSQEQKGVAEATEETLHALSKGNEAYDQKFGFVFLICATGKTAAEMLAALQARLPNTKEVEIQNAKIEQGKITKIRLKKWLDESEQS